MARRSTGLVWTIINSVFLTVGVPWPAHSAGSALHIGRDGSNVVVNFAGWLQSAERVDGPYTNVHGATSPYRWPVMADSQHFWRSWTPQAKTFAAGRTHTIAIQADGSLWAWGGNDSGQLGNGTFTYTNAPVHIGTDTNWHAVACGSSHTVALKVDGSVWAWGNNEYGQLGNGVFFTDTNSPARISADTGWQAIACGGSHTVALKADGSLWAWGQNFYGQLGTGMMRHENVPTRVGADTNWQAIACGSSHTMGLKTDGSLWAWGANFSGALGNGSSTHTNVPIRIGQDTDWRAVTCGSGDAFGSHTMALKADGSLYGWGRNDSGQLGNGAFESTNAPTRIGAGTDWQEIACGGSYTVALKTDGSLWAWGRNEDGQLGNGRFEFGERTTALTRIGAATDWQAIACGSSYTVALKTDGSLWAWGRNGDGQLGNDTFLTFRGAPARIGAETDWQAAACGGFHTVALKADGSLWAWGANSHGRLGNGTFTSTDAPTRIGSDMDWLTVACGEAHTVALKVDGSLWTWGYNFSGQLGNGTFSDTNAPTRIGSATEWQALACGFEHSVALKDGSLWAWGANSAVQLGIGTFGDMNAPTRIGVDTDWQAVACGDAHTVALKADGSLWAWGNNFSGQLGDGTDTARNAPTRIGADTNWQAVACGGIHTVALKADGSLWAWGDNGFGQLDHATPLFSGTNAPARIGADTDWQTVACGNDHTVALKADGSLWAWGRNEDGQLGSGTFSHTIAPTRIGADTDWQAVTCATSHTVALKTDGSLYGWGSNEYGQIAQPVPWLPHPVVGGNVWGQRR